MADVLAATFTLSAPGTAELLRRPGATQAALSESSHAIRNLG
jgi:hypothetical protein